MNLDLLLDPMFRLPFAVGLLLAMVLPLLGVVLRLRDEWLAALGLAHLAGASGLLGMAVGLPVLLGAPLGAVAGALVKSLAGLGGNTTYGLMILVGWAATLLVATNTSLGAVIGHALAEGQLYFTGGMHLVVVSVLAALVALGLPRLLPYLLRARLFPGQEIANRLPAWRWHLSFDVLAALGMAAGAGCLGLMAAFALVLVPPWVAFRVSGNLRHAMLASLLLGLAAYVCGFATALLLDQPFAPVLVVALLALAGLALPLGRRLG